MKNEIIVVGVYQFFYGDDFYFEFVFIYFVFILKGFIVVSFEVCEFCVQCIYLMMSILQLVFCFVQISVYIEFIYGRYGYIIQKLIEN